MRPTIFVESIAKQLPMRMLGRLLGGLKDVLFGSTGFTLPGGYLGYFTFGRPPNLADRYLSLRIPSLTFVNDDACEPVVAFLENLKVI